MLRPTCSLLKPHPARHQLASLLQAAARRWIKTDVSDLRKGDYIDYNGRVMVVQLLTSIHTGRGARAFNVHRSSFSLTQTCIAAAKGAGQRCPDKREADCKGLLRQARAGRQGLPACLLHRPGALLCGSGHAGGVCSSASIGPG